MITAETVNGIVRFPANGLPVVSLYCRVDPGASQREVSARVDSLLDRSARWPRTATSITGTGCRCARTSSASRTPWATSSAISGASTEC